MTENYNGAIYDQAGYQTSAGGYFRFTTSTGPSIDCQSITNGAVGVAYNQTVGAIGGTGPYTFSVVGTLPAGLSLSSSTGAIGGTPTASGSFSIMVTDANSQSATGCAIVIGQPPFSVNGNVFPANGGNGIPGITVSINTTPVQTTTTNSNGSYSFANVPNGSYTVTPSLTAPPASVFYPASQNITVNGHNVFAGFNATLGYTVSGTVTDLAYNGKPVYLSLQSTTGNINGWTQGTSVVEAGGVAASFTIQGVPPGTYTVQAWLDPLGFGKPNVADPTGSSASFTVSSANAVSGTVTVPGFTLTDPTPVTPGSAPTIVNVSPGDQSAVVQYKGIQNSGVEQASSYNLQWCSDPACNNVVGSKTFKAKGLNNDFSSWLVNPFDVSSNGLINGQSYYFEAQGLVNGSPGPFSSTVGPVTIGAPAGGNTVSGTVSFTGTATGPLYVVFYDFNTGNVYATGIANPVSPQPYMVQVPTGSSYYFIGAIDQNNDGLIGPGDIANTKDGNDNPPTVAIVANTPNEDLTLDSANSSAALTTGHFQNVNQSGVVTNNFFTLNFNVFPQNKLPVSVEVVSNSVTSGANLLTPMDIAVCMTCGSKSFNFYLGVGGVRPIVGDSYGLQITYNDGTSETLNAVVSGSLGGNALATGLSPNTSVPGQTTPTFTWTAPVNPPTNYTYQFSLYLSGSNGSIWQIPGNNSNFNDFSSSTTSLAWPTNFQTYTDPVGDNNPPSVNSLTGGQSYAWQVVVQDGLGNQAISQRSFTP